MCLIVFDWAPQAPTLLTLAANRDEWLSRATQPLQWWRDPARGDAVDILAGRDMAAGGTWLGLTRDGRFAALTNFRRIRSNDNAATALSTSAPASAAAASVDVAASPAVSPAVGPAVSPAVSPAAAAPPSRGGLVTGFLQGQHSPLDYLNEVAQQADRYNGFNLLVGQFNADAPQLAWYGNRSDAAPQLLPAGRYGLSNALLDTPWPKVNAAKRALGATIDAAQSAGRPVALDDLIALLQDRRRYPDALLPFTGVTLERERELSAAFIEMPGYGTRCTTALRVARSGHVAISEYGDAAGDGWQRRNASFEIGGA